MQNSKICQKCRSDDIVKIPGTIGSYGVGNNIIMGWTIFKAVKVTRYICISCGFSEEWVESSEDLIRIKKKFGSSNI
jgi:hypothetical protein